uniref:Uncharacterized protein n=1 Tax=Trichogramma kaykai TaxID=54128 RepID=A0ABD2X2G7_9HYME
MCRSSKDEIVSVSSTSTRPSRRDLEGDQGRSVPLPPYGGKRKHDARDDEGELRAKMRKQQSLEEWLEQVRRCSPIHHRANDVRSCQLRPQVATVRPNIANPPSSQPAATIRPRPCPMIDLGSVHEDDDSTDEIRVVFEHVTQPTPPASRYHPKFTIVRRPTPPLIESPASPSILFEPVSLESRPPSPLRFTPTPPPSYTPVSSVPSEWYYGSDDASEDAAPPVNLEWLHAQPLLQDDEIDHEVALVMAQRVWEADDSDHGYWTATSEGE